MLAAWLQSESLFFFCATVSTVLFLIMFALSLFGGQGDVDFETGEAHTSSDASFKIFSVQSILSFLMGFGWTGLAARIEWGFPYWLAAAIAFAAGLAFMFATAWMLAKIYSLSHEPKKTLLPAVGAFGRAYMSVPSKGQGKGQVQVEVEGQLRTVAAISSGDAIPEFSDIEVIGVHDDSTLIVRSKME